MADQFTIEISTLVSALRELQNFEHRLQSVLKDNNVLQAIGIQLVETAKTNIEEGGRPTPFKPLAPSTLKARKRKGYTTKPMFKTGDLQQSLAFEISGGELYLTALDYLKYHQFNENRQNPDKFPARPVFTILPDDKQFIADKITQFLTIK